MKSVIMNSLVVLAAIAAAPIANAAASRIQIPLVEEKVYNEKTKFCFYSIEINLGDFKTAKPYQVFTETETNRFEQMQNWHSVSVDAQGHLILKITSAGEARDGASCVAEKQALLLN